MVEQNNSYKAAGGPHRTVLHWDWLLESQHIIWFPHQQTSEIRHALLSLRQSSVSGNNKSRAASKGKLSNELTVRAQPHRTRDRQLQKVLPAAVRQRQGRSWALRPVFNRCSWTYGQKGWVENPGDAAQDDQDLLVPLWYWLLLFILKLSPQITIPSNVYSY